MRTEPQYRKDDYRKIGSQFPRSRRSVADWMAELDRQRGERIRQLREARAWSQTKLAREVGVETDKTVRNWEDGKGLHPENLEKLAQLFDVSPDYLRFGENGVPDVTALLSAENETQMDRIEAALADLRSEVATARDEVAALELNLTKQMRSLARKLGTSGKGSQSQTGG